VELSTCMDAGVADSNRSERGLRVVLDSDDGWSIHPLLVAVQRHGWSPSAVHPQVRTCSARQYDSSSPLLLAPLMLRTATTTVDQVNSGHGRVTVPEEYVHRSPSNRRVTCPSRTPIYICAFQGDRVSLHTLCKAERRQTATDSFLLVIASCSTADVTMTPKTTATSSPGTSSHASSYQELSFRPRFASVPS